MGRKSTYGVHSVQRSGRDLTDLVRVDAEGCARFLCPELWAEKRVSEGEAAVQATEVIDSQA